MKNFKCTLLEKRIHIQGDAQDLNGGTYPVSLLLSTEETSLSWEKAVEWAKEHGGELPTYAQLQAIQAHRDEINAVLKEAGKQTLGRWYWTCEEYPGDDRDARCVDMSDGDVDRYDKLGTNYVRAVSAFPTE